MLDRNKINHLVRLFKKQYGNNYFNTNISNTKKSWKGMKQLVQVKPKVGVIRSKLIITETHLSDPNVSQRGLMTDDIIAFCTQIQMLKRQVFSLQLFRGVKGFSTLKATQ